MTDYLTACLSSEEEDVKAILTAAPYSRTYVTTYGPFSKQNLLLEVAPTGQPPGTLGGDTEAGDKVLIHTTV
jgi:hypothetical protein